MKINISYETVDRMFELCKKHKEGKLNRSEFEALLDHEDYQIEIERYNNAAGPGGKFSKEQYVDYFMNFFNSDESNIENKMLRFRCKKMKHFFDNLESYEKKVDIIKNVTESDVKKALEHTYFGLPDEVKFEEVNLIFSVGLGASEGFNAALKESGREDLCI